MKRCDWCLKDPLYVKYHDEEWGVPLFNDQKLFELLILEGMQAGLSWFTILKKRENFRLAFNNFNLESAAALNDKQVDELLQNPGIIRNRRKIIAVKQNARAFLDLQEDRPFHEYIWEFVSNKPIQNQWESIHQIPSHTDISDQLSKDLKKRGFNFVGSTICYALMQSIGMVNDHIVSCFRHKNVK